MSLHHHGTGLDTIFPMFTPRIEIVVRPGDRLAEAMNDESPAYRNNGKRARLARDFEQLAR